jgi:hypothetical protein
MIPKLQLRFDTLENSRRVLLESLETLDEAQLQFQPEAGKWSIIEVLHHLLLSEQRTYSYMMKKNQAESLPKSGMGAALRSAALTLGLRLPLKYKSPQKISPPERGIPFPQLKGEWDASRRDLRQFLDSLPAERTRQLIFRHPVGGYFNIFHTLDFFEEHFRHHLKQIDRIQKRIKEKG